MATSGSTTEVLERVKVREVVGVFRSRDVLDAAVHALLSSGFDRADIDVVVAAEARQRLAGVPSPQSKNCRTCRTLRDTSLSIAKTSSTSGRSFSPY
jgi:hypothetical protein